MVKEKWPNFLLFGLLAIVALSIIMANVNKAKEANKEKLPIPISVYDFEDNYKKLMNDYDDVYKFESVYVREDAKHYGEEHSFDFVGFLFEDENDKFDFIHFESDKPSIEQVELFHKSFEMEVTDEYLELLNKIKSWDEPGDWRSGIVTNNGIYIGVSYYDNFMIIISADN